MRSVVHGSGTRSWYDRIGDVSRDGRGLFAQSLVKAFPDLPIEEERRLSDPAVCREFIAQVFAHQRRRLSGPDTSLRVR